jgi:hypothetical protein
MLQVNVNVIEDVFNRFETTGGLGDNFEGEAIYENEDSSSP